MKNEVTSAYQKGATIALCVHFFSIQKSQYLKQLGCLSVNKWIIKICYTVKMYFVLMKNKISSSGFGHLNKLV